MRIMPPTDGPHGLRARELRRNRPISDHRWRVPDRSFGRVGGRAQIQRYQRAQAGAGVHGHTKIYKVPDREYVNVWAWAGGWRLRLLHGRGHSQTARHWRLSDSRDRFWDR